MKNGICRTNNKDHREQHKEQITKSKYQRGAAHNKEPRPRAHDTETIATNTKQNAHITEQRAQTKSKYQHLRA